MAAIADWNLLCWLISKIYQNEWIKGLLTLKDILIKFLVRFIVKNLLLN